jgi:hypothetical protein
MAGLAVSLADPPTTETTKSRVPRDAREGHMSADGKWNIVIQTPMGPREAVLDLAVQGATFSGTANGAMGESAIEGVAEGNRLTWTAKITNPMPLTLAFDVIFTGDNAAGKVKLGMLGDANVTGARA